MLSTALFPRITPALRHGARLHAFGQVGVLAVAALLGLGGGQPVIMGAGDVSAWQNPLAGPAGSAATLFAALSIVLARAATRAEDRVWRRGGHGLLLAWALFWLIGCARAASADPDALFVTALLLSFAGTACQAAVSLADLRSAGHAPAPAPSVAAASTAAAVKPE
jgi:hypothetical protein